MTSEERASGGNAELVHLVRCLIVGAFLADAGIPVRRWILEGAARVICSPGICEADYAVLYREARDQAAEILGREVRRAAGYERNGAFETIAVQDAREDAARVAQVAARLIGEMSLK